MYILPPAPVVLLCKRYTYYLWFLCGSTRVRKYPSFQSASSYWKINIQDASHPWWCECFFHVQWSNPGKHLKIVHTGCSEAPKYWTAECLPTLPDWFQIYNLWASSIYYFSHWLCVLSSPYGLWGQIHNSTDIALILLHFFQYFACSLSWK